MGKDSNKFESNCSKSKKHLKCRVCGKEDLTSYLDLGQFPLPNNLFKTKQEALDAEKFSLNVCFCKNCGLSQLNEVVDPRILFSYYVYKSGVSKDFIEHCRKMAIFLKETPTFVYEGSIGATFGPHIGSSGDFVVDIAGNDGTLLQQFKEVNPRVKVLNIDPSKNMTDVCRERGIPAWTEFLTIQTGLNILKDKGVASIVVAQNVTAHVDNLRKFLLSIKIFLADWGVTVLEFPYLVETVKRNSFGQIYAEHLSYLTLLPIIKICSETGFKVVDVQQFDIHDGTLRVIITHEENKAIDTRPSVEQLVEKEIKEGYNQINVYKDWEKNVRSNIEELRDLIIKLNLESKKVYGFAASAKGNTLLNACGFTYKDISYIVDDTPEKQGQFSPGTGIPIVDVEMLKKNPPDYLLILAPNFTKEIKKRLEGIYFGKYIIPVPEVVIE